MGGKLERAADVLNGATRQFYHESHDGQIAIRTYQDVEPHLEYCKKVRREEWERRGQFGKRGDWHRTMALPTNVIYAIAQRLGIAPKDIFGKEQQKRILAEAKRSEFAGFRTTNDRLIGK